MTANDRVPFKSPTAVLIRIEWVDRIEARRRGRVRRDGVMSFSYPLPLPGMEAMFSRSKKHGYTSCVERMVLRIRLVESSAELASFSWDDVTVRWSDAAPEP